MTSPVIRRLRGLFQSRMKPVPRLQTQCHWSPKAKNLRRDEVLERQPMLGSRGTIQASWFNWRHSLFLMQIRFIPWRCFFRLCGQWRWAARFLERILKFLFGHIWIHLWFVCPALSAKFYTILCLEGLLNLTMQSPRWQISPGLAWRVRGAGAFFRLRRRSRLWMLLPLSSSQWLERWNKLKLQIDVSENVVSPQL
jgi:hypothetical protein